MNSFRKHGWDYSSKASYLVTIVTRNRYPFFGFLDDRELHHSDIGRVAIDCWSRIPDFHPHARIGEFVVMPEHLHGIIHFESNQQGTSGEFGPQYRNLGSVIRGFKSAVTSRAREINPAFKWQKGYDDKILFTQKAVEKAEVYIRLNPTRYRSS